MMPCGIWLGWATARDMLARLLGSAISAYRRARSLDHRPDKYAGLRSWMHEFAQAHRRWGHRRAWTCARGVGYGYVGKRFVRSGLKKDYESCPGRNANASREEIIEDARDAVKEKRKRWSTISERLDFMTYEMPAHITVTPYRENSSTTVDMAAQ